MMTMKLSEVASAVGGRLREGSEDLTINRLFTDSRDAEGGGGLFFAMKGERADGHDYVAQTVRLGNAAIVSDEKAFVRNTVIVGDVREAVTSLARYYRAKKCPLTKAICITGSVGKTTTKDMTGLVFAANAATYVTPGNRNSMLGLPLSIMSIDSGDEYAVLELGMSERGEIEKLSRLAKPWMSMITVIGSSHLEALGSRENIRDEKFDILKGESPDGSIILNADCDIEYEEGLRLGKRAIFCGIDRKNCDFTAYSIAPSRDGSAFTVRHGDSDTRVVLNVPGRHNVYNALLAFAAGVSCGFDPDKCASALFAYSASGNRQHIYEKDGVTVIADCYNASPESMKAAFGILGGADGRKIAVLGDMLELGEGSDALHAGTGAEAAKTADILVFVGDRADVYRSAVPQEKRVYTFGVNEKKEAAALVASLVREGDTVLFKASNRLHLEDIIKDAGL